MVRPTSATSCGASPSDGSSISSTRGLPISARPIASICCSPPESEPATWACRSCSRGNNLKHALDRPAGPPPPFLRRCAATIRFSRTVSVRNMRRPCGTRQMPLRAMTSGASPADRLAVEADRAAARLEEAHDGRHAGGLAGAVAAEQPEQPARLAARTRRRAARGCRRNRCRCRRWRAPQSPRYTSRVRGSATTSARVPSTITSP